MGEPARPDRLTDREIRVRQIDVLAHNGDGHRVLGVMHSIEQVFPAIPHHLAGLKPEGVDDVVIEILAVQQGGDVIDARHVNRVHHGSLVNVTHERDFPAVGALNGTITAQHQSVWLNTNRAQSRHRVLGRLCFLFP